MSCSATAARRPISGRRFNARGVSSTQTPHRPLVILPPHPPLLPPVHSIFAHFLPFCHPLAMFPPLSPPTFYIFTRFALCSAHCTTHWLCFLPPVPYLRLPLFRPPCEAPLVFFSLCLVFSAFHVFLNSSSSMFLFAILPLDFSATLPALN